MGKQYDLSVIAEKVVQERGFIPEFPASVLQELDTITSPAKPYPKLRDLRSLLWVSIDNDDSLDLDQLTYAEKDHIYVAIADVDALVKRGSAVDAYAQHNATSVYTPTKVFPMLHPKLSTNLTSLNEECDRLAIVVEIKINDQGEFSLVDISPALVRNHAKLTYNGVGAFLEGKGTLSSKIKEVPEQLKLQDRMSELIKNYRMSQGALSFVTREAEPIIKDHEVAGIQEVVYNRAHAIIENFMIAANACMAHYLAEKKQPTLRRIVRTPKRWNRIVDLAKERGEILPSNPDAKALEKFLLKEHKRDPEHFPELSLMLIKLIGRGEYVCALPKDPELGHFDLALHEYAHTTAPNRRFADLVTQRILKSHLFGEKSPYSIQELKTIAQNCTDRDEAATKVERRMRKSAAAIYLSKYIGKDFRAVVTGSGEKGTWVRLQELPIEGKLVKGYKGLDVGDWISVKLIYVDVPMGFIDFSKV